MYVDKEFEDVAIERPLLVSELQNLNQGTAVFHRRIIFEKAIIVLKGASYKDTAISTWLVDVGPEFLDELRQGHSMALAIYMHWGTLLDQMHGIWWAKFSGKRLVQELSLMLQCKGSEWTYITTWCREQVGLVTDGREPSFQHT
jgi:hypothetical protein